MDLWELECARLEELSLGVVKIKNLSFNGKRTISAGENHVYKIKLNQIR
jgi:hypothetical protein